MKRNVTTASSFFLTTQYDSIRYPLGSPDSNLQIWAVEDYPRTIQEVEERFSSEEGCRAYLVSLRWPDGFRCPHCQGSKAVMVRATLFRCCACRRQTSATAGTIFQDTRQPLMTWFRAMWYVTSQKNGASALGLQRVLRFARLPTGKDARPTPRRTRTARCPWSWRYTVCRRSGSS